MAVFCDRHAGIGVRTLGNKKGGEGHSTMLSLVPAAQPVD
jgi:hypothetical protein